MWSQLVATGAGSPVPVRHSVSGGNMNECPVYGVTDDGQVSVGLAVAGARRYLPARDGPWRLRCPRFPRLHAMVHVFLSSNPTGARRSSSVAARSEFIYRRGCPSGFVESQGISPVKPQRRAINVTGSLKVISLPVPRLMGVGSSMTSGVRNTASAAYSAQGNPRLVGCPTVVDRLIMSFACASGKPVRT